MSGDIVVVDGYPKGDKLVVVVVVVKGTNT